MAARNLLEHRIRGVEAGATTVDIAEPLWRLIKNGAVEEKEIADCLQPA
jgi:L-threonylcarbamoyladenylate synthase